MKKFKLYLLLAFAALIIPLTSCEHVGIGVEFGNGSNSYYEMTDYLCIFTQDRYGYIQESRYTFVWDWYNSIYTSIRMKYGTRDYSYMENISIGGNRLNCLLDGEPVYFEGK